MRIWQASEKSNNSSIRQQFVMNNNQIIKPFKKIKLLNLVCEIITYIYIYLYLSIYLCLAISRSLTLSIYLSIYICLCVYVCRYIKV